jgi:hypothetical protein
VTPLYGFRAIAEVSGIDVRILAMPVRDGRADIIFRVLMQRQRRLRQEAAEAAKVR